MAWVKIGPKASLKIMMLIEKLALNDLPEDCWILMHIAVEDSLQRKGLGRHLLSEIFKGKFFVRSALFTNHFLHTNPYSPNYSC